MCSLAQIKNTIIFIIIYYYNYTVHGSELCLLFFHIVNFPNQRSVAKPCFYDFCDYPHQYRLITATSTFTIIIITVDGWVVVFKIIFIYLLLCISFPLYLFVTKTKTAHHISNNQIL